MGEETPEELEERHTAREVFVQTQAAVLDRYGVVAESRFVPCPTVDGQAHVLVAGSGPPVVVLNGIGVPAAMWAPLMAELKGFTLYCVDLPSFGLTDTTHSFSETLRPNAVSFLENVIERLELNCPAMVANSLGSLWALWFAIDRPDSVSALVHVGCPAITAGTSAPLPMRLLSTRPLGRLMMKLQPPSPAQVKQLAKMVGEHPLPPEVADLILATEKLPGTEATFLAFLNRLLRLRGARPDIAMTEDQLAQAKQPNLLVFANNDPMGAESAGRRMARALPDAELHMVDGGHAPWVHHADQIGHTVEKFLSVHSTS